MAVTLKPLLAKTQLLHPNEVQDQTCPICFDDYLQDQSREFPRKLPCGHIIGTECLLHWASAQNGTAAIRCPRCTKQIIDPPGAKQTLAVVVSLAETMAEQAEARIAREFAAIDLAFEEQQMKVLVTTILLVVLGAYFDSAFAWFLLRMLYLCAIITTGHRFVGHRRLGLLFIGVGFCVGEFVEQGLGFDLMGFGQTAYHDFILRTYEDHPRLVLGGTFGILLVLLTFNYPFGGLIIDVLVLHFMGCVVNLVLNWMAR